MTATATVTAPRPPTGANESFVAPSPEACVWCGGACVEPFEELGEIPCLECNGSGVAAVEFDLPRSRSLEVRRVIYAPACTASGHPNRLRIETAGKATHRPTRTRYHLVEIEHDWPGRAFVLGKLGTDRVHHVYIAADGVRCDCEGETYQSAAKANQAAWESCEDVFPTYGCKHADALVALLLAGWF